MKPTGRFVRRPGLTDAQKSLPSRGGWHPASHASRMTEEVIFVPLVHPTERNAFWYDTSSVACGDTFPSRGRTWGQTSFRFRVHRNGLRAKIPPLEGRVASGVPRKPDDGRGDLRSACASVGTECFLVRHLFRRLRRHLPLEGKDFGVPFVPLSHPSERTAIRYDTSSVACGDTFPSRGRTLFFGLSARKSPEGLVSWPALC